MTIPPAQRAQHDVVLRAMLDPPAQEIRQPPGPRVWVWVHHGMVLRDELFLLLVRVSGHWAVSYLASADSSMGAGSSLGGATAHR
jgi:hypothetical protein